MSTQWDARWDERSFTNWWNLLTDEPRDAWRSNFVEMRRRWKNLLTVPATSGELTDMAHMRLLNDPTVVVYVFVNGVEQRQVTHPWQSGANFLDDLDAARKQKAGAFSKAQ